MDWGQKTQLLLHVNAQPEDSHVKIVRTRKEEYHSSGACIRVAVLEVASRRCNNQRSQ
jgi:hypothetical protein